MKRSEILKNRQIWINRLKDPNSKKSTHRLKDVEGFCCLGHGCDVLLIDAKWTKGQELSYNEVCYADLPPTEFENMVGLWDKDGSTHNNQDFSCYLTNNLVSLNDETNATPQEIGEYLESVIEGGEGTPFRPLSSYDE